MKLEETSSTSFNPNEISLHDDFGKNLSTAFENIKVRNSKNFGKRDSALAKLKDKH